MVFQQPGTARMNPPGTARGIAFYLVGSAGEPTPCARRQGGQKARPVRRRLRTYKEAHAAISGNLRNMIAAIAFIKVLPCK